LVRVTVVWIAIVRVIGIVRITSRVAVVIIGVAVVVVVVAITIVTIPIAVVVVTCVLVAVPFVSIVVASSSRGIARHGCGRTSDTSCRYGR
jgi:hypothetical protein